MAQKVQVILVDDLDGGPADETVSFSLDGIAYEVDLSAANAETMRETLAGYVGVARRVGGRASAGRAASRPRKAAAAAASGARDTTAIREWARENGYEVSERGRISAKVLEAYDAAH